jgi:hypothetical protein
MNRKPCGCPGNLAPGLHREKCSEPIALQGRCPRCKSNSRDRLLRRCNVGPKGMHRWHDAEDRVTKS